MGTFGGHFILRTDRHSRRLEQELIIPKVSTALKRKNSLRYFVATIWNSIPSDIRNTKTYNGSYSKIKKLKPECGADYAKTMNKT